MTLALVQGDTGIILTGHIIDDETGDPLDLTGCDVFFQMRKANDLRYTINAQCDIDVDPTTGIVTYAVGNNDLNTAGDYQAQFEVHFPDTSILTTAVVLPVNVRRQ